jgi:DNA modification methylase
MWYGPTNEVTVWDADRARVNDLHPTQKPVQICERAIRNSSDEADVVLDLFGGSGSTMAACEQNRRASFTLEIAPGYCDVIVKRWENLTGKKAVLEAA